MHCAKFIIRLPEGNEGFYIANGLFAVSTRPYATRTYSI
jgi:hypothetical protein